MEENTVKKALSYILAIVLALAMLGMFAACNNEPDTPTEPEITTEVELTTEVITTEETTTNEDDPNEETTTDPDATTMAGEEETAEAAGEFAPPANLGSLSAAEQLTYFNLVTSRVRTEKPGYTRTEQLKIQDMKFTGVVSAAQSLINRIVSSLMPGDLVTDNIAKNADNKTKFLSENNNPSELRAQDINSIKSTKSGDNWIIEVRVKDATNPAKNMGSTVGRIAAMQTREEIFDSIMGEAGGLIAADTNNATVRYHAITARVTVNAKGQVIEASNGFDVSASATGVKMLSIINTNADFTQTSRWTYKNFNW